MKNWSHVQMVHLCMLKWVMNTLPLDLGETDNSSTAWWDMRNISEIGDDSEHWNYHKLSY